MEIKQIQHFEYVILLDKAKRLDPKVSLNISPVKDIENTIYLVSNEGISYLRPNGMLGGLARFKKGSEKIAKLHQNFRINLGGNCLECYDTKLVEIYENQGFHVVARLKFDPNFAPNGWEMDADLKNKPDIVFLSLKYKECLYFNLYKEALDYCSLNTNFLCRKYVTGHDKDNYDAVCIAEALNTLKQPLNNLHTTVKWLNNIDLFFKDTKDYIRITHI